MFVRDFMPLQFSSPSPFLPFGCVRSQRKMRAFPLLLLVALLGMSQLAWGLILPRTTAPAFTGTAVLPSGEFGAISFPEDFQGQWAVLFWYPADFTFVCPTEIIEFSSRVPDFAALNAKVVGISTDTHHVHLAWTNTPRKDGGLGKIELPLIGDPAKTISQQFGVVVQDPADGMFGLALRGVVIVDPRGIVRHSSVNDDQVGRNVDEILRLVKGFQEAEKTGKVCPANWTPGGATIVPNHQDKVEFFSKADL